MGIQNPDQSKEGDPRLYLLFLCHHVSGEPTPDSRETDQAAYFSLEEQRHIQAAYVIHRLYRAEKG